MTANLNILSDIDKLVEGSAERRAAVLLQVTDLLVTGTAGFSDDTIALFDDVICRIAQKIESSVRVILARRIAPFAHAPINLSRMLASDDDIDVAEPILVQSERLDQTALVTLSHTKSQAHLLAIAQRKALTEAVTDVLVERGGRAVLLCAAKNTGASFSKSGFSVLATRSAGDDDLAECVGSRTDIPKDVLLTLISVASEMVRSKLIAEHPLLREDIEQAVNIVAGDLKDAAAKGKNYGQALLFVKALSEKGELTDRTISSLIQNKRSEETIVAVAQLCGVQIEVVERAFADDQPETILVLAKAASLAWPTAKALLSMHSGERELSQNRMSRSMASFERLNFATARKILEFYRTRRTISALH